jgi:hypothetical protein
LIVWISWVDDCLAVGKKEEVIIAKKQMMEQFDCDKIGNMDKYGGCRVFLIYATPGDVLVCAKSEKHVFNVEQFKYRSGIGKLLHMMQWSRPEVLHVARELLRYMWPCIIL